MEAFTTHTGIAAPLRRSNVDTDQIVPSQFLKRITKTGFEDALFYNWRQEPDFLLNQEPYTRASVLVTGPDFGTGSSREHAVWALRDFGFRVVLSPRFGDIFRGNTGKQGIVAGTLKEGEIERLWTALEAQPGAEMTVDLTARTAVLGDFTARFGIDDYTRWRLLEGLDDIGLTLRNEDKIAEFEARREGWRPRTVQIVNSTDS